MSEEESETRVSRSNQLCIDLFNTHKSERVAIVSIEKENNMHRVTHIIYNGYGLSMNILGLEKFNILVYTDNNQYFIYHKGKRVRIKMCPSSPDIFIKVLGHNHIGSLFILYSCFCKALRYMRYAAYATSAYARGAAYDAAANAAAYAHDAAYAAVASAADDVVAAAYARYAANAAYAAYARYAANAAAYAAYARYAANAAAYDANAAADATSAYAYAHAAADANAADAHRHMREAFRSLIRYRKNIERKRDLTNV